MLTKIKAIAARIADLVYPPTKAKLHRLVTWVGVVFGAVATFEIWAGQLGLTTVKEKLAGQLATITMLAAGWQRARPKVDAAIDSLPIPENEEPAK